MNIQDNSFICCDCMEVLREIPDKKFDLCLTDPPYGIGEAAGANHSRGTKRHPAKKFTIKDWDNSTPSQGSFSQMRRTSSNQIFFGGNYFPLPPSPCWLVWDKNNTGDFADCELAWTSFSSAVRKFKYTWNGMLQEDMKNKELRVHPTQKPVALFIWCLEKYSKPGDLIIDPFCGSGTTAIACHKTGRRFVCIDKEPEYIRIAQQRYKNLIAQTELLPLGALGVTAHNTHTNAQGRLKTFKARTRRES